MTRRLIISCIIICFGLVTNGQSKKLSLHYDHIQFRALVDTIENQAQVRVYFADQWVDSLFIDIDISEGTLSEIFSKALANSQCSFIIIGNEIIITRDRYIKTNFSEEFMQRIAQQNIVQDTIVYEALDIEDDELKHINEEFRVFKVGNPALEGRGGKALLSGFITETNTGLPIVGAVVYNDKLQIGGVTDENGFYEVLLPLGAWNLEFRTIGMRTTWRNIELYSDGQLNVSMTEQINKLDEVTISANRENKVQNMNLGVEKINLKMLKQIPMGLGEVDLIKSSLQLPGIQSVGEASAGFNVRGGSVDQNLILLDDAPIMNSSHFFGFFSAFNSDMVEEITLYKGGIPSKFGGRVSSVMDIRVKEGSNDKYRVSGGISPVTGRIMLEGPVFQDKSTLVLSARATFSDYILAMLDDLQLQKSSGSFMDFQGRYTHNIDKDNTVSISGYYSRDRFDYYRENAIDYSNFAGTVKWRHTINSKFNSSYSVIISDYNYQLENKQDSTAFSTMNYRLGQSIVRADYTYFPMDLHKINFGLEATYYKQKPGNLKPSNEFSDVVPVNLEEERAILAALYVGDEIEVNGRLSITAGLRFSMYGSFGPKTVLDYYDNVPRTPDSVKDTLNYGKGTLVKFYPGLDFRFSTRYLLAENTSVKAGIHRTHQYIHMISNTTAISPTDIWKISDQYLPPQRGDQVSVGIFHNMKRNTIELSAEAYYKRIKNIVDYKGGAILLMNENLETILLNGLGKAYGVEFMIRKVSGPVTGWVSYTYSRVFHKVQSDFQEETINNGEYFPADYDKPHDVKLVLNAKLSRRFNITSNFIYNTGRPITYPIAYYNLSGASRLFYSNRNEFRIPDYIRLDLAATLNGNLKRKKLNHSSLTLAVYNVFGRRNPYSIFFRVEDGNIKGYKMSIFGQPIITLTYNFKLFGNAAGDF